MLDALFRFICMYLHADVCSGLLLYSVALHHRVEFGDYTIRQLVIKLYN